MTQTMELTLTGVAAGGEAIGRDPATNKIVFVADAIPGERVRVGIDEERKRWMRGHLLEVMEASPDRISPPCPYFGPPQPVALPDGTQLNADALPRCAGCRWQHIAYTRQLALKRQIVVDQLARLSPIPLDEEGELALVDDVIALGDPNSPAPEAFLDYGYRIQMYFVLDDRGRLCLPGRDDSLVPIAACLLHHPQLAQLHDAFVVDDETAVQLAQDLSGVDMLVGATAKQLAEGNEGMLVLTSRFGDAPELALELPVNVLLHKPAPDQDSAELLIGDWSYPVALGETRLVAYPGFGERQMFWPHSLGNEALVAITADLLQLQPFENVLDLWAGVGIFSVGLAGQVGTIIAVEEHELAIAALQTNLAGLDNVDLHPGEPRYVLSQLVEGGYPIEAAVLSPPDGRLAQDWFEQLAALGATRAAVVTADLAGLARSLGAVAAGGFELVHVQPVDLVPQQDGVTLIALFQAKR